MKLFVVHIVVLSLLNIKIVYAASAYQNNIELKNILNRVIDDTKKSGMYFDELAYGVHDLYTKASKSPCEYLTSAIQIVNKGSLTQYEEIVLSNLLRLLPANDYLIWMEAVYKSYTQKRVSSTILERTIFLPALGYPINMASDRDIVKDFYRKIENDPNISVYWQQVAGKVISGDFLKSVKSSTIRDLRKVPLIPYKESCNMDKENKN